MNEVQASRLRMMLAAGQKRLARKQEREEEADKIANAERILGQYIAINGPLTHETPRHVLELARFVAHRKVVLGLGTEPLPGRHERLTEIWSAIRRSEQAEREDRMTRQEDRLRAQAGRGRVRGVGAAARRAGF